MENENIILYAEDEDLVRDMVVDYFKFMFPNYSVKTFNNGTSLERELLNGDLSKVKVVVLDNNMPGINGGEIIKKYTSKLNFSFILHYAGDEKIGKEAKENGAYAYALKPETMELMNILKKILKE